MARFDVFQTRQQTLVIDCQADLLAHLNTRFVVPLLPLEEFSVVAARLNPVFEIGKDRWVMYTQFASAIPVSDLGEWLVSLESQGYAIINALDMLLTGV